jgi:hypothetical protein
MRKLIATDKKWFEHIAENYPKDTILGIDSRLLTACKLFSNFKKEDKLEQNI